MRQKRPSSAYTCPQTTPLWHKLNFLPHADDPSPRIETGWGCSILEQRFMSLEECTIQISLFHARTKSIEIVELKIIYQTHS